MKGLQDAANWVIRSTDRLIDWEVQKATTNRLIKAILEHPEVRNLTDPFTQNETTRKLARWSARIYHLSAPARWAAPAIALAATLNANEPELAKVQEEAHTAITKVCNRYAEMEENPKKEDPEAPNIEPRVALRTRSIEEFLQNPDLE